MLWVWILLSGRLLAPVGEPMEPAESPRQPELDLGWEVPAECPERTVVLDRVKGLLGRPLGEVEGPPVRVEARVDRGAQPAEGLRLLLRIATAEGVSDREMSGQTCDVLVDAAALVIAIALDPSLALGPEPEPEPEPPSNSTPLPECAPVQCPASPRPGPEQATGSESGSESESESESESVLAGTVRAAATGSLGPLPSIAPGFEVAVGLVRRHARVELGFDYFFARRADGPEGRGGEIQLWTVAPRGCWVPAVSILEIPVCGGIQVGPMRGEGQGVGVPSTTRLAWVAAEAGGALVIRGLPLVDVWLGADLVVPLTRPGFFIDQVGLVHRSGVVGGEAAAGLEVRFGPGRRL